MLVGLPWMMAVLLHPCFLPRHLAWLPDYTNDPDGVKRLLYPDDAQDVPRAVKLMKAIIAIGDPNFTRQSNPIEAIAYLDAIQILSKLLKHLLYPFININLSLHQQIKCLSKFSHINFSLYRANRTSALPAQLFFDSQCMVKNVLFSAVRQQVLDDTEHFYVIQVGEDRLETLFGRTRMLGARDSGMNVSLGCDRLSHACDIDDILRKYPRLDCGNRRLSYGWIDGVDHITPDRWYGDVISGQCDIITAWSEGQNSAADFLANTKISPCNYDYTFRFLDHDTSLMRCGLMDRTSILESIMIKTMLKNLALLIPNPLMTL